MENQQPAADDVIDFKAPFTLPENKFHTTTAALNTSNDKLYLTDSSIDLPAVYVARVELEGSPDKDFGEGGWKAEQLDLDGYLVYNPAGLVPRGTAGADEGVIAGICTENAFGLVCFNADASLDTGFGSEGKIVHRLLSAIKLNELKDEKSSEKNQRFKVVGSSGNLAPSGANDGKFYGLMGGRFAEAGVLMRFLPDGKLDETFGAGSKLPQGMVDVKYKDEGTGPVAVVHADRDGVVVVGTIGRRGGFKLFFARYTQSGALKEDFGENGFAVFTPAELGLPTNAFQMELNHVVKHPDGGFFASGYVMDDGTKGVIVRVDTFGKPDERFNGGKALQFEVPGADETDFLFGGLALQFDGTLVAGGGVVDRSQGYTRDMLVARFLLTGELDTRFFERGWLRHRPFDNDYASMSNLLIHPDDKTIFLSGDAGTDDSLSRQEGVVVSISHASSS